MKKLLTVITVITVFVGTSQFVWAGRVSQSASSGTTAGMTSVDSSGTTTSGGKDVQGKDGSGERANVLLINAEEIYEATGIILQDLIIE